MPLLLLIGLVLLGLHFLSSRNMSITASQWAARANEISTVLDTSFLAAGIGPNLRKYLIAQSKVESGNFRSELALKHNNFFGMKWAAWQKVDSVQLYGARWAAPIDLRDAARIQIEYLNRNKYPKEVDSPEQFVQLLASKKYFGDESADKYLKALKSRL